ncbi:PREDICTED: tudor domain-containing protein 7B-like [Cyprinodon variegatus]|uniref:tudor domain-containing protein 7B-like n=1 Tax=Cyprinodon variegatus TaxID=28743 RepID=UPI0007427A0E|nr:PREDICTED: tudor domain-containing protein 7B-like [Cyprinodon variegatus]
MANNSDSPTRPSPTIKTRSDQVEHVLTDERAPETLHANVHQAPVFRVKRVDSHRSLIYSCVIATETELWDVGDIFTDAFLKDSVHFSTLESEKCQTALAELDKSEPLTLKPQTLQSTQPGLENCSRDSDRLADKSVDIPEFEIRKFEESEVVVSHVVSPSDFYIQLADSPKKLEALFTDQAASRSYAEQKCIPDIGAQVICWFPKNEQWCRAQVVRISGVSRNGAGRNPSINVEVKRLDYGDTSCVPLCHIKQLSPEMAVLPLQALQVSLAHVRPVNGRDWTEEAVDWFKAMVHGRTLYARLYPQGLAVSVELFLERGKLGAMRRGASLSQRLAHNGHAKHKLKNNGVVRKSAVQLGKKEQESQWEKYLISCYSQNKK